MICTCTMNPSLDYFMEYDKPLKAGALNRSQLEYYEAGGKGINVSIVLNNLQIPSRATGFLGGFTKDFYIRLLQKYTYVQPNFTYIEGHTRINVKLSDGTSSTDLNAAGPYITYEDMANLREKVRRLDEGDYFVLAGKCPEYLNDEIVAMLKEAIQDSVKVCLDTNGDIVERVLADHPFLIKTTTGEMQDYYGKPCDPAKDAQEIHARGAKAVMIMNSDCSSAVLACDEGTYEAEIMHEEKTLTTFGSGDALTAGYLMNYLRSRDCVDSFRFASCCSSATAYSKGLAPREKIESFYDKAVVKKLL